ncbi:hypothetical protein BGZ83_000837 [Gryganskiella cystojenkinii]|nr:hypothetical protein BGZ83_000837 [Gryganskiella cystojenkinii]
MSVPPHLTDHIATDYFQGLNDDQKRAYLQGMADILAREENLAREITSSLLLEGFTTDVSFVGMKYRGGHQFQENDVVALENEYLNEYDRFAVKVLVDRGQGQMDHVAYVASKDARALRRYAGFDRAPLQFVGNSNTGDTARYRVTFPSV